MKHPKSVSPFAALTRQEQQEKWLTWQSQRVVAQDVQQVPLDTAKKDALPPLKLPTTVEKAADLKPAPAAAPPSKAPNVPTGVFAPQAPRHAQYDAVLNRIDTARKKALNWQSVDGNK